MLRGESLKSVQSKRFNCYTLKLEKYGTICTIKFVLIVGLEKGRVKIYNFLEPHTSVKMSFIKDLILFVYGFYASTCIYGLMWKGNEKLRDLRVKTCSMKVAFNLRHFCMSSVPKYCYYVYSPHIRVQFVLWCVSAMGYGQQGRVCAWGE